MEVDYSCLTCCASSERGENSTHLLSTPPPLLWPVVSVGVYSLFLPFFFVLFCTFFFCFLLFLQLVQWAFSMFLRTTTPNKDESLYGIESKVSHKVAITHPSPFPSVCCFFCWFALKILESEFLFYSPFFSFFLITWATRLFESNHRISSSKEI